MDTNNSSQLPFQKIRLKILTTVVGFLGLALLLFSYTHSSSQISPRTRDVSAQVVASPTPRQLSMLFLTGRLGPTGPSTSLADAQALVSLNAQFYEDMVPKIKIPVADAKGPFTINAATWGVKDACLTDGWVQELRNQATAGGVNLANYTNIYYNVGFDSLLCPIQGHVLAPNGAMIYGVKTFNDYGKFITTHEMGHGLYYPELTQLPYANFGLSHVMAASDCRAKAIDLFTVSPTDCTDPGLNYDITGDPMGNLFAGFNAIDRWLLSGFSTGDIIEKNPGDFRLGEVITLNALDTGRASVGGINRPGPHVLKVNRPSGAFVMLSFRKKEGWDTNLNDRLSIYNQYPLRGASLHYYANKSIQTGFTDPMLLMTIKDGETLNIGALKLTQQSHTLDTVTFVVNNGITPTLVPTATPLPTLTPTPTPSLCNTSCITDGQCGGGGNTCSAGKCKCPVVPTVTPTPTIGIAEPLSTRFTSPVNNTSFVAGTTFNAAISITNPTLTTLTSKWYLDNNLYSTTTGARVMDNLTYTIGTTGNHTLKVVVTDSKNNSAQAQVIVSIVAPSPSAPPNKPPVPTITAPTAGQIFLTTDTFKATAYANDPENSVQSYKWYLDNVLYTTLTDQARSDISFSRLTEGSHTITVVVTDTGNRSASAVVTITVRKP